MLPLIIKELMGGVVGALAMLAMVAVSLYSGRRKPN